MPLPINSQGLGAGPRPPEEHLDDHWPDGLHRRVGDHIVQQPPPEQPADVVIPIEQPAARVTASMGWGQMVRLFFYSLLPTSQVGVQLPQLAVPSAADVVALGLSVAAGSSYGTMFRSGQMTYSGLSRARALGRAQGQHQVEGNGNGANAAPERAASSRGVEVECAAVEGWYDLDHPPQEEQGGSDAPLPSAEVPAERIGRPRTHVRTKSAQELSANVIGGRLHNRSSAEVAEEARVPVQAFIQAAMAVMDAADAREESGVAPDAFDQLSTQIVCDVEEGGTFPISLSWLDAEGQYHEQRTVCEESLVLEVPRGSQPVILDPPMSDLTGVIFARVGSHVYTDGRTSEPAYNQAITLLKLARQLERDKQWGSLLAVTENFLAEVEEAKAPELTAQMRAYKAEAERHIHQQEIDAIPDPLAQTMLGILAGAGIFVLSEWYAGYRRGERGMPLVTRPVAEVVAGVRRFFGGQQAAEVAVPLNDDDHIDGRRLEELGAVGGEPPRHQEDDDWCADDWFDD